MALQVRVVDSHALHVGLDELVEGIWRAAILRPHDEPRPLHLAFDGGELDFGMLFDHR